MMKFRRRGQQVPPAPGGSSPRRPARQDARLQIQDVLPGRIRPAPARPPVDHRRRDGTSVPTVDAARR